MKKYGFVSVLVFGCFCGPLWGGGWDLWSVRGAPPDEQLYQYVQGQMPPLEPGGNDRAPDDFLLQAVRFRAELEVWVEGMGQVNVQRLLGLAGPEEGDFYPFIEGVLDALGSKNAQSVDYILFIGQLEDALQER